MSQLLESFDIGCDGRFVLEFCESANFDDLMYEVLGRDSIIGGIRLCHLANPSGKHPAI